MILWWGKKGAPNPKTGETPVEPLAPGETPATARSLDEQIFGAQPAAQPDPQTDTDDDPIGLMRAAARITAERAAEAAAREATVLYKLNEGLKRSSSRLAEGLSAHMLEMFPCLSSVKVMRQWAGMADMTPDFAPIMGLTPVPGFFLDAGWGTWGFKATPVAGKTMAHTVAHNETHPLITGFGLDRFANYRLTGEKGAASVGH